MTYEKFIRRMPKLLVLAAILDLVKQFFSLSMLWQANRYFSALGSDNEIYWKIVYSLFDQGLGAVLYPFGWLSSAVVVTLLLALYDRGRVENA